MFKKLKISLVSLVCILALVLCGMIWGMNQFSNSHFFLDGKSYPENAVQLDLRNEQISVEHYHALRSQLPDCDILWNVPLQGSYYSSDSKTVSLSYITEYDISVLSCFPDLETIDLTSCQNFYQIKDVLKAYPEKNILYQIPINGQYYNQDTTNVTIVTLSSEEIEFLTYFPNLETVDASHCTDYSQLIKLHAAAPHLKLNYSVPILGQTYSSDTTELSFQNVKCEDIRGPIRYLPNLSSVYISQPQGDADAFMMMLEENPDITFTYEKTVLGKTFSSETTVFDFSGMKVSTSEVRSAMMFFPNAEKVIMSHCGNSNETMKAFRDEMREQYKVVWTVYVSGQPVRTDDISFHASGRHYSLVDDQSKDLYYCEDMIVVDIGHSCVKYVEWLRGMPNLKYLILADNWLKDISPISSCKKLIYLELYMNNHLEDLSPLLELTLLQDLNVSRVYADFTPLTQMVWLNNLWMNECGLSDTEEQHIRSSLPNTRIETDHYSCNGNGWRVVQNYYDMRDIMGTNYIFW